MTANPGDRNLTIELYKVALQTRNFEISLFWQRSNYFLVLNTAIAAGFLSGKVALHPVVLALLGLLASVLWVRVNLGGKFWQARWEHRLSIIENQLASGLDLFSAPQDVVVKDVRQSLGPHAPWSPTGIYNRLVLRKPSVSKAMTILSGVFVLFWIVVLVYGSRGCGT